MNWFEKSIINAISNLDKKFNFGKKSVEHIVLDEKNVNILTIDVGNLPYGKAEQYLSDIAKKIESRFPQYKIILISKRGT